MMDTTNVYSAEAFVILKEFPRLRALGGIYLESGPPIVVRPWPGGPELGRGATVRAALENVLTNAQSQEPQQ